MISSLIFAEQFPGGVANGLSSLFAPQLIDVDVSPDIKPRTLDKTPPPCHAGFLLDQLRRGETHGARRVDINGGRENNSTRKKSPVLQLAPTANLLLSAQDQVAQITEAANFIRSRYPHPIRTLLILGSGLGPAIETYKQNPTAVVIPYRDIPHFPQPTVSGHSGNLILLELFPGYHVACLQGRTHYYECRDMFKVTFATRTLHQRGAQELLVTNAAGGVNKKFRPGNLMLITDHINNMGDHPLMGENIDSFGPRFPDMTYAYDKALRKRLEEAAKNLDIPLRQGVYMAGTGPTYETPAEIRKFRRDGADAVGMSTTPEVIVANHMGMSVVGISIITNMAAGVLDQPLNHEEVLETGRQVGINLTKLIEEFLRLSAAGTC